LDASGSSSPAGSLTDYAWDFDGGKTYATDAGGSASESHTFSVPGTYTVDLRIKDSLGETATTSETITVGAALGQYEQAVEGTTGIAHFWPMGESSGSSFADLVGGANATLEGGVTLGQTGGLVEDSSTSTLFDGSSGAAHAPIDLSGTHQLTVEFWMKWSSYGADDRLALEFTPNFNEHPGGFLVDPDATPGSDFAVSIGEGGSRNTVFFERPSAGAWHYYAFAIDTSAAAETQITPYVDGHAVTYTKSESGTGAGNFADSTLYWMSRDASSLFGEGNMQDLALYEGALSAETILEHYEHGENTYRVANTTPPSIEGTSQDGQKLVANTGIWSGGTPISYAYQWQSCNAAGGACEDIEGATEPSYELSSADLETKLRVRVIATNTGGSAESTSAASSLVESGAPDELEAPSVIGEPNVGETLHADPGEWGGTGTEVGYQWERCNSTGGECADIDGATGPDFEPGEGDIGSTLRLRVGISNELGSLTAVSQITEAIVVASLLVNTWAPSITGMDQSGQTLTAEAGSWLGEAAISYSYQWLSCDPYGFGCEEIVGATGSSYALGSGNIGHGLRVRVSATETGGSVSETSATTQPVTDASAPEVEIAPIVSGTGLVGYKLTASDGAWSGEEALSYSYQWVRCGEDGAGCSAISGATADSYTLKESDAASTVRVVVTATDAGSHSTEAVSPPLAVSAATLVDVAAPSISGSDQEGQALNADVGIWTGSGAIDYAYQWKRCNEAGESCSSLSGATESSYTPVAGDIGHTLKVVVTGSGTAGTESVSSSATPVIGAEPFAPIEVEEPTLEGYGTVGDTLTAQYGLWAGTETISYSYEWQTCNAEGGKCKEIEGATSASYVLTESEIGSTVRVVVTATNTTGNESAPSVQSEIVAAPAAPEVTESPAIQGSLRVGVQAHLDNGVWSGSRPLRYYYQWQRCSAGGESCAGIEGATKASYTPESGDVGSTLRVRVTVSNSLGSVVATTDAVSVASATEASIEQALEAAEATDPSVLTPSTS
ncbi:MAG TPA: LamG-like jellyroll fold domain-containing protein, partial [Mycobacterium sp.]|nr:LamG-like jellyroll fold domain-containing protein [Mycobacterium sp.]